MRYACDFFYKDRRMEKKIRMTLTKSMVGSTEQQRATLLGLGLTWLNKSIVRKDTPEIRGMLKKVGHLVRIEE